MIATTTILAGLYAFLDVHKEDIASKIIASASYDILKKSLDFSALKRKLGSFFKKENDSENFVEALCNKQITADAEITQEVKQVYEEISGQKFDDQILKVVNEWLSDSKGAIENLNIVNNTGNSGGFNIGSQNAGRNIFNIQGDYKRDKE
ncbi:hypothetical protein [Mucilaginibacter sp. SJ]|uniref:hypothetical protein n=1 Tax=Mucilaginibacter sp. SJ TaxID=3029053 RepID=UPI0023A94412|nr:hypothetical protein [Mucilaginibacter sp. SJ]WEA00709.1 hypothetical protein MusilaSJ_24965 [Mucilaginibacter sp. SJ]